MREIRQSGSEGGEITKVIFPTPIVGDPFRTEEQNPTRKGNAAKHYFAFLMFPLHMVCAFSIP